jgi:hypothetical protein
MHEIRNFTLVVSLMAVFVWAIVAWFFLNPESATLLTLQRYLTLGMIIVIGLWLFYGLALEDRLPDHLRQTVGEFYYEADGLSFLPVVRVNDGQAELRLYYQNRYENLVEAIIHLRPPEDSFVVREGLRDIHFAFRAGGGDFGVVHQPIAVPRHLQGEVIELQLAAASYYPRSHGAVWRKNPGMPCGTMVVDWSGGAFKSGVHEGSNEMELTNAANLHLTMPLDVDDHITESRSSWNQQVLIPGQP